MRQMFALFGVLAFTAAAGAGAQGDADNDAAAAQRLQAYLDGMQSFEARFQQKISGSESDGEESSGRFYLKRPGKLRWDYEKPHTQAIVADGRRLWVYDAELKQVVVKTIDEALAASTPAMLLAGRETVSEGYKVSAGAERDGKEWVRMLPKRGDTDFLSIELGFAGKELQAMELRDKLGQTTRIEFSRIRRNGGVDDKLFEFKPPKGVDVIGSPEQ